jgi:molecular chaperone DnaK
VKKSLTEYGDKIDAAEKASIESALKEAEELLKDQNASKEALDAKLESLSTVSQKLGEKMYAAAQAEQAAAGAAAGGAGAGPAGGAGGNKPDDANVVDADFKEVKDDKK